MSEIATSVLNPNSIYSEKVVPKNEDPVCVDVKGEEGPKKEKSFKPTEAPIKAVRER